jgi:hypothetical protein
MLLMQFCFIPIFDPILQTLTKMVFFVLFHNICFGDGREEIDSLSYSFFAWNMTHSWSLTHSIQTLYFVSFRIACTLWGVF